MPSNRRLRLLFYVVLAGVITTLFFTSRFRQNRPADTRSLQDFYHKTVNAMEGQRGQAVVDSKTGKEVGRTPIDKDADGDIDGDDEQLAKEMAELLKAAEQRAKDLANAKAPNKPDPPSEVIGVGSSAAGQGKKVVDGKQQVMGETVEEHEAEVELDYILKKAPMIIFSKSYCPFSKKAKGVLLDKYVIEPPPHVVELDEHLLGAKIQARLAELTGRKTVPNIVVSGKSIGGSDEIAMLDGQRALAEKIMAYGGNRIEVKERFIEDGRGR